MTIVFKNKNNKLTSEKFFNKVQKLTGFPKADMVYYDGKNDISMKIGRKVPVHLGKYLKEIDKDEGMEWYLTIPHEENIRKVAESILEFANKVNLERFAIKYSQWYVIGNVDDGVDVLTYKIKQTGINRIVFQKVYKQDTVTILESIIFLADKWKTSATKKEQMLASIGRIAMMLWNKKFIKERTNDAIYTVVREKDQMQINASYRRKEEVQVNIEMDKGIIVYKTGNKTNRMDTFQ